MTWADEEGGITVLGGRRHPIRLAGRIVGQLVLEEDVGAALAAPAHLVLLVVLDRQAVGGDVAAGDDQAGGPAVDRPTDGVAVVGPPCPEVVDDRVVALSRRLTVALRWRWPRPRRSGRRHPGWCQDRCCSPDRGSRRSPDRTGNRIPRSAGSCHLWPDCDSVVAADVEENWRVDRSRVDDHPGELHPAVAGRDQRRVAPLRHQGGEALSQHHGVGMDHHDRLIQVVHARGENEVLTACERHVDEPGRRARVGHKEAADGQRVPGSGVRPRPRCPRGVGPTAGTKTSYSPALFM